MVFLTTESFTTNVLEKYGNVNTTECFSSALDVASFANVRLDQLFFEWLLLPETAELLQCFDTNIQLSCDALEEVLQNVARTTTSDGPVLSAQGAKSQQEQLLSSPLGTSLSSLAACKAKHSNTRTKQADYYYSSRDTQTSFPHEAYENSFCVPNASCKDDLKKQERSDALIKIVNNGTSVLKQSQNISKQDGSLTDDFSPKARSHVFSTQFHTSDQRCFAVQSRTTSLDPLFGTMAHSVVELSPVNLKSGGDQKAKVSAVVLTETISSPAKTTTARDRLTQFTTTKTNDYLLKDIAQQDRIATTHQATDVSTALPMEVLEENEGSNVYSYKQKENVSTFCEKPASSPLESNNETPKLKNDKVNTNDVPYQESLAGFSFPTCTIQLKTDVPLDPYLLEHIEKLYASVLPALPGLPYTHFEAFLTSLGMSKYLAPPLFADLDTEGTGYVSKDHLIEFVTGRVFPKDVTLTFFHLLRHKDNPFITAQDLKRFVQVVIDRHPGLEFMKPTPEFQQRYAVTVVTRLLYMLDLHGTKKVYLSDLRRFDMSRVEEYEQHYAALQGAPPGDNGTPEMLLPIDMINAFLPMHLPGIWASLDDMDTVNYERFFFSFEHFYVINAMFSDLDQNHDFALDQQDLLRYDHHALSMRTVTRIAAILGSSKQQENEITVAAGSSFSLSYEDFIVMILNEEDKTTSRSLEFWFRVVDLDEDGYIRPYEMQYFYEEQAQRLEALNQESIPFQHVLCQMNDLMNPRVPGEFTLTDFIRNKKTSGAFFDMLLSLTKTLTRELRDPYQTKQEMDENPFLSPWDRFALREYHLLLLTDGQEDVEQTTASEPEQPPSGCATE